MVEGSQVRKLVNVLKDTVKKYLSFDISKFCWISILLPILKLNLY